MNYLASKMPSSSQIDLELEPLMDKRKLLYTPYPKSTDNPYLQANVSLLEELGFEVIAEPSSWSDRAKFMLSHLIKRDIDTVVVNWHENLFRHRNGRVNWLGIPVYLISLLLFRAMSRRLIYVRHNLYPHSFTKSWKRKLARALVYIGQQIANVKATHSGHLENCGFKYLPHTLYKTFPKAHLDQIKLHEALPDCYYTMFGFIERYKRVEEIIERWNGSDTLLIAGNCKDQVYLAELHRLAEGKSVQFITRFIEEDEAQRIVGGAQGLIIAHADEDMIVSGSFFFGLSVGTPLFAIRTPFLDWFSQSNSSSYLNLFESTQELVACITLESNSSTYMEPMGKPLEQIRKHFSNENVKEAWSSLIRISSNDEINNKTKEQLHDAA